MSEAPIDWDAIYRLVDHAQELEPAERESYIRSSCGDDTALLDQVLKILASDVHGTFLEPPTKLGQGLFGGGLQGRQLGPYQLEGEIARGGMGVIYLAHEVHPGGDSPHEHSFAGKQLVVKVLPQIQRSKPAIFERFQREAQAAAQLQHPHALQVLDSGETEGIAWYAMPYVEGHDLHRELLGQKEKGLPSLWPEFGRGSYIAKIVGEIAGIADALQGFHEKGITHRDIKPRNLLLDQSGHLMLADFGLAKISELETLTQSGAIQGTPHYMSPEQARVLRIPIDHRTDIYSLSVVLYELLSLKRPFDSKSAELVVSQIASGTHIPLRKASPRTPRDLTLICEKGMAHHPRDRYQSAQEFAQDLQRFLGLEAVLAKPAPLGQRAKLFVRSHRLVIGLALLLIAMYGAWLASAQWQESRNQKMAWQSAFIAVVEPSPSDEQLRRANAALADMTSAKIHHTDESITARGLLEQVRQDRHEKLQRLIDQGKGRGTIQGRNEAYQLSTDQLSLVRAHQLAQESARIFPQDPVFKRLSSIATLLPDMTVRFDAMARPGLAGSAWAYPLDTFTSLHGSPIDLGPLPVENHTLSAGEWRIVVRLTDGTFFEYDRVIRPIRSEYRIQVLPRETAPSTTGMLRIEPKDNLFPIKVPHTGAFTEGCCYSPSPLPLADYWIDAAVVSNRQYLRYLTDSGAPAPVIWNDACLDGHFDGDWHELPTAEVGEAWLDLPATGVPCIDALGYAEFYGKRLAGHYEMEYALRGPEHLLFPWGSGPRPGDFKANIQYISYPTSNSIREKYKRELSFLLPVRAPEYQHPPFGLFHALGNVTQRTWGLAMYTEGDRLPQHLVNHVGDRLVFGESYGGWIQNYDYSWHDATGQSRTSIDWGIGFRCVISAQAPPIPAER